MELVRFTLTRRVRIWVIEDGQLDTILFHQVSLLVLEESLAKLHLIQFCWFLLRHSRANLVVDHDALSALQLD